MSALTAIECFCDKDKGLITSCSENNKDIIELCIPELVKKLIFEIPEKIKHNKPSNQDEKEE